MDASDSPFGLGGLTTPPTAGAGAPWCKTARRTSLILSGPAAVCAERDAVLMTRRTTCLADLSDDMGHASRLELQGKSELYPAWTREEGVPHPDTRRPRISCEAEWGHSRSSSVADSQSSFKQILGQSSALQGGLMRRRG